MDGRQIDQDEIRAIRKAQAGDAKAFDALVQRYFGRVYAVAYANLKQRESAEDAAQEAFLRAYINISKLEHAALFSVWVVRIAKNLSSNWRRNGQRASRLLPLIPIEENTMEIPDKETPTPRDRAAAREEEKLLQEAILSLSEHQAEIVLLHFGEGMSQAEIARHLGVNRSSVNRALDRAVEALKSSVESKLFDAARGMKSSRASAVKTGLMIAGAASMSGKARADIALACMDTIQPPVESAAAWFKTGWGSGKWSAPVTLKVAAGIIIITVSVTGGYRLLHKSEPIRAAGNSLRTSTAEAESPSRRAASGRRPLRSDTATNIRALATRDLHRDMATTGPRFIVSGTVQLSTGEPATSASLELISVRYDTGFPVAHTVLETSASISGYYHLSAPLERIFLMKAQHPGFGTVVQVLRNPSVQIFDPTRKREIIRIQRDVTLAPAVDFSGMVVNGSGAAVPGAQICAGVMPGFDCVIETARCASDSNGQFALKDISAGPHAVFARAPGLPPAYMETPAPDGRIQFVLSEIGAEIEGTVVDAATQQPIPKAALVLSPTAAWARRWIGTLPGISGNGGSFSFDRLASGKYALSADLSTAGQTLYGGMTDIKIRDDETTSQLLIALYAAHTVRGVVREKESGAAIPNANVQVRTFSGGLKPFKTTKSDSEGSYELTGVPSLDNNALDAGCEGFDLSGSYGYSRSDLVHVSPGLPVMTRDIEMVKCVRISGIVVDEADQPVPEAEITYRNNYVRWPSKLMHSRKDGTFSIYVWPSRPAVLGARAEGFSKGFSRSIVVASTPISDITIRLSRPASIKGMVVDPAKAPVSGAIVQARIMYPLGKFRGSDHLGETLCNEAGEFDLKGLSPGNIVLTAESPQHAKSEEVVIPIESDATKEGVVVSLRTGGHFSGKVLNEDGKPARGAQVTAMTNDVLLNTTADENGAFKLENVPPTTVSLYAKLSEGSEQLSMNNMFPPQDNIVFSFQPETSRTATFIGYVVDAETSVPVTGFTATFAYGRANIEKSAKNPGYFSATYRLPDSAQAGTAQFHVSAPGYLDAWTVQYSVRPGDDVTSAVIRMGHGGSVKGRLALSNGAAVAGAAVEYLGVNSINSDARPINPSVTVKTSDDGAFILSKLPEGYTDFSILPEAYYTPIKRRALVQHGGTHDFGTIIIPAEGGMKGRVVRDADNSPVPNTVVVVETPRSNLPMREFRTDSAGNFRIIGLSGWINVAVPDHKLKLNMIFSEETSAVRDVEIRVGSGSISGQVMRGDKPARAALKMLSPDRSVFYLCETDDAGLFTQPNLAAGHWSIIAEGLPDVGQGYGSVGHGRREIDLSAGERETINFQLYMQGIGGVIFGEDGKRITELRRVSLDLREGDSSQGSHFETKALGNGHFSFPGLTPGEYRVSIHSRNGMDVIQTRDVTVSADPKSQSALLEFKLRAGEQDSQKAATTGTVDARRD